MNDTLFDEALKARDEAIVRVTEHAGEEWPSVARAWMRDYLKTVEFYLPDAAWSNGCPEPPNTRRAFGPCVVRHALKSGWMTRDGEAPRLSGHTSPGPRYRSTLYRGQA